MASWPIALTAHLRPPPLPAHEAPVACGSCGSTTVPGPCLLQPVLSGLTAGPASCSGGQPCVCTEPGRSCGCPAARPLPFPSELMQVGSRCPAAVPLTAAPGRGKPRGPTLTLPSGVPTLLPECPLCCPSAQPLSPLAGSSLIGLQLSAWTPLPRKPLCPTVSLAGPQASLDIRQVLSVLPRCSQ